MEYINNNTEKKIEKVMRFHIKFLYKYFLSHTRHYFFSYLQGILYGPDGIIIKNGTFGTSNEQSANEQPQFNNNDGGLSGLGLGDLGGLPRILNNLNLANNKYTNLLRKIADFAGLKLPFR